MYETFTVYMDRAALHWLLNINDPSGRLICFRLGLTEFHFEDKYKKGKANTQADALCRLNTFNETIHHDDSGDIPVFTLELLKVELEPNKHNEENDFLEVDYANIDELYVTKKPTQSTHP